MKNDESLFAMNWENLFSFYFAAGRNSACQTGKAGTAKYIKAPGTGWPSYLLGGEPMPGIQLEPVFEAIRNDELPYFWIRQLPVDTKFEHSASAGGMRLINYWKAMHLYRDEPFSLPAPESGLVFEKVSTQSELQEWLEVVNREIMTNRSLPLNTFLSILESPDFGIFRVRKEQKTLSTVLMYRREAETGIFMVSTVLEERGKGIGGWITATAIDRYIAEGCRDFVLQSTVLGYPVYKRLGFSDCGEYGIYWMLGKKQ